MRWFSVSDAEECARRKKGEREEKEKRKRNRVRE
jgi:hypothetical protein